MSWQNVLTKETSLLSYLRDFFNQNGIESYLVGGYVRDSLLGRESHDIDLAVAEKVLPITHEVANALGGSFVLLDDVNKIARVALPQNGEWWHLDFSTIRGNIAEDLACRDFTINAIAVSLNSLNESEFQLIDPLNGQKDLKNKTIRAVSDSVFQDDPARLIRAVRFAAELNFTIENTTEELIKRDHRLITKVAGERVKDELYHIFVVPKTDFYLRYLDKAGLLDSLIPELTQTKGVTQPKEHFWDVFDHSIETVKAVEQVLGDAHLKEEIFNLIPKFPDFDSYFNEEIKTGCPRKILLKLAALLHDIAKPQTKTVEESGKTRFLGHPKIGATVASSILRRLRFSSKEIKIVAKMVENHLRPGQLSALDEITRRAIYRYFRDTEEVGIDTLYLNLADHLAARGPTLDLPGWKEHTDGIRYILSKYFEEKEVVKPPKLISGYDLIEKFEMKPGPEIGKILEAVREAQASGEIKTKDEALEFVAKASHYRLRDDSLNNLKN